MPEHVSERIRNVILFVLVWIVACGLFGLGLLIPKIVGAAHARPNAAWEALRIQAERYGDEQALQRYNYLRDAGTLRYPPGYPGQPPGATYHQPCCGQADAYEADDFRADKDTGELWAILTCNDPADCQEIVGKVVRKPGTEFKIPPSKMLVNFDPVNHTGHGWIWISPNGTDGDGQPTIYCYAFPGGG